jgi:hypothetical protein
MAEKKVAPTAATKPTEVKKQPARAPLFYKENYMWMIIGAVVIVIGMVLMAGGKNENPGQFDYNEVYSFSRITIAPILILAGLVIEIYAIFKKPKVQQQH